MICPEGGGGEIQGSSISPESYDWPNELIWMEVCFRVFSFSACRSQPFRQLITPKRENVRGPAQRLCLDCLLCATVGTWQPLWKRKAPSGFYRLCGWLAVLWLVLASSKCKGLVSQRGAREEFRTFEGAPLCSIHGYLSASNSTKSTSWCFRRKSPKSSYLVGFSFAERQSGNAKGIYFHLSTCRKAILTHQISLLNFKCFLHLYHKKNEIDPKDSKGRSEDRRQCIVGL